MDLRQLRSFVAVAEELHFGRAAERLRLAQPALSRQIQQLESDLNFQLFQRTKRRVQLTPAGEVFLEHVRGVFERLQVARDAAQSAARGQTGWLSVGFVGSTTFEILPAVIRSFRKQSPDVELSLTELSTGEQLDALREKRIHVGFLRPPVSAAGVAVEMIAREAVIVALPSAHPLAQRSRLALAMLAAEPFILFPRTCPGWWRDYVRGLCLQCGFEPKVVQETKEIHTAISLVAAGVGITLVPASVQHVPQKQVAYRRLTSPTASAEMVAAYRVEDPSPVLRDFLTVLRSTVRRTGAV